jgi:hypothetical protein
MNILADRAIEVLIIMERTKIERESDIKNLIHKCQLLRSGINETSKGYDYIDLCVSALPSSYFDDVQFLNFKELEIKFWLGKIRGRCEWVLKNYKPSKVKEE